MSKSSRGHHKKPRSTLELIARSSIYADVLGTLLDGPKRPVEIADELGTDRSSISGSILRLKERGLIETVNPPFYTKGNQKWYDLTPDGCMAYIQFGRIFVQNSEDEPNE